MSEGIKFLKKRFGGKIKSVGQLIKVFIRKCKKEGIVKEYRDKLIYETKGQKKRRKKAEGKARAKSRKKQKQKPQTKR